MLRDVSEALVDIQAFSAHRRMYMCGIASQENPILAVSHSLPRHVSEPGDPSWTMNAVICSAYGGVQDALNLGWKLAQVVKGTSPDSLLDTYHAERHPIAARVLWTTMAQVALQRTDDRTDALREIVLEFLDMEEPRKRIAAEMSGLGIRYELGGDHPLVGRRMPDLDLDTANGTVRVYSLLHSARPVLLNLGERSSVEITSWADRVQLIEAEYTGTWDLPAIGSVTAPATVLVRPDGHVAWVGDRAQSGLAEALITWLGPPAAA
jgi:3-(3-hydroxy-phenyl)propionate hydroxylase